MRKVRRTETWECWLQEMGEGEAVKETEGFARKCGGETKRLKSQNPRGESFKKDEVPQSKNQDGG